MFGDTNQCDPVEGSSQVHHDFFESVSIYIYVLSAYKCSTKKAVHVTIHKHVICSPNISDQALCPPSLPLLANTIRTYVISIKHVLKWPQNVAIDSYRKRNNMMLRLCITVIEKHILLLRACLYKWHKILRTKTCSKWWNLRLSI